MAFYTYVPGITRSNGDSMGVENMDIGIRDQSGFSSLGTIISTGVGKEIGAFKILVKNTGGASAIDLHGTQTKDPYTGTVTNGTSGATTTPSEMQVNGVVEAILKVLSQKVTVLAYQVENDTSGQISVIFEQTAAWSNTDNGSVPVNDYGFLVKGLSNAITALGTAVGVNATDISGTVVWDAGKTSGNTFGSSIKFA